VNSWKVILATLVIFGAGVITGGLLVSYSDRALHVVTRSTPPADNPRPQAETPVALGARENRIPPPMPVPLRKDFLAVLERELNLSGTQKDHIEKIISDGQERTREVWRGVEPDMRRELIATRERIRNELTPDQRIRFEDMMRRPQRRPDDFPTNRPPRRVLPPRGMTSDPAPVR
jgi:hypothetical protein